MRDPLATEGDMTSRAYAGIVGLISLLVLDWLNVPFLGDIWPFLFGAPGALWQGLVSLVGAGISLIPLLIAAVAVIALAVVAIFAVREGIEYVAGKLREYQFELLLSTFSLLSGGVIDLAAKAANVGSPGSEVLAVTDGFAALLGGIVLRRGGLANSMLGIGLLVIIPVVLIGRVVTQQPLGELVDRLRAVPLSTITGLVLVGILAAGVLWLGWKDRKV